MLYSTAVYHLLLDLPHAALLLGFAERTASAWGLWLPWAGANQFISLQATPQGVETVTVRLYRQDKTAGKDLFAQKMQVEQ